MLFLGQSVKNAKIKSQLRKLNTNKYKLKQVHR